MNTLTTPKGALQPIELVLGAGGIKGYGHIGLLKALAEARVLTGQVTGVSVGSIVAAFHSNGFSPDQITEVFLKGTGKRLEPMVLARSLVVPDPVRFAIGGTWMDLYAGIADMVAEYGLKPNANLRIVACDVFRQQPVAFEGTDYDLAHAIAASCSLPGVFLPQWHEGTLLVDGAWYHYNPVDFCRGTALVSAFRPATQLPSDYQLPIDLYFHLREMYLPLARHSRYVDPTKHVVVEVGLPDVAGLNFGLSQRKCLELVANGYDCAMQALAKPENKDRVPRF